MVFPHVSIASIRIRAIHSTEAALPRSRVARPPSSTCVRAVVSPHTRVNCKFLLSKRRSIRAGFASLQPRPSMPTKRRRSTAQVELRRGQAKRRITFEKTELGGGKPLCRSPSDTTMGGPFRASHTWDVRSAHGVTRPAGLGRRHRIHASVFLPTSLSVPLRPRRTDPHVDRPPSPPVLSFPLPFPSPPRHSPGPSRLRSLSNPLSRPFRMQNDPQEPVSKGKPTPPLVA